MAFLQIIAHANVPWSCLEEGFVCAMNCRNGTPSQVAVVSGTQHLHTGQATALSPILQLRLGQAAASFGGEAEVAEAIGADGPKDLRLFEQQSKVAARGMGISI